MYMSANRAAELAAATPIDRDRYVDFLRAASLGTVILGHWLMAVIVTGSAGVSATNVLGLLPALQPLTWLLQVMPVFFFVGGFSHAVAWDSLRRRGGTYPDFVRARAARLLIPTAVFAACWLVAAIALELSGQHRGLAAMAARVVAQPLWFIGVYLGIVALAPIALAAHRRYRIAVPLVLAVAVVAVDAVRFALGVPYIGYLNLALVWLAVHQLGFWYADGRLGSRAAAALAGAGLTGVLVLTTVGPYPVSMVGLPGEEISNMAPPTLALLAHAAWLIGLVMLVRPAARRWLRRPRPWRVVVAANGFAMTAFLWHLSAMFLAGSVLLAVGIPEPTVGDASWWALRLVWVAAAAGVTAALVAVFGRADNRWRVAGRTPATGRVSLGVLLCLVGVLGLSAAGFGGALSGRTGTLLVVPVTPVTSALLLAIGLRVLRLAPTRHRKGLA